MTQKVHGLKKDLPPAVTRLANQVITIDELFETCKNERMGKIMTMIKQ